MTKFSQQLSLLFTGLSATLLLTVSYQQAEGLLGMMSSLRSEASGVLIAQSSQTACVKSAVQIGGYQSCFSNTCTDGQKYYSCRKDNSGKFADCLLTEVSGKANCFRATCRGADGTSPGMNYQLVGSGCNGNGGTQVPPTFSNRCTKSPITIGGYVGCQLVTCSDGQKYDVCRSDYTGTHVECTLIPVPSRNNCFRATCASVSKPGATRMQDRLVGTGCGVPVN